MQDGSRQKERERTKYLLLLSFKATKCFHLLSLKTTTNTKSGRKFSQILVVEIFTKLPWSTFRTLSSVSPSWRQAIQAGLVYDARVRTRSADTFILINATDHDNSETDNDNSESDDEEIETDNEDTHAAHYGLYSLRDRTFYQLPPITQVERGYPHGSQCVALDGKVYVLGGVNEMKDEFRQLGSKEVYVLDLGGRRQWKQCASMQDARLCFGCCVKDGKLYVFGGTSLRSPVRGSEVYDPRVDTWSATRPMGCLSSHNEVATAGEDLFVYNRFKHTNGSSGCVSSSALKAYHPSTDTWRTLSNDFALELQVEFMALGKFHAMSISKIDVWDFHEDQWMERHTSLFPAYPERFIWPMSVVAMDKELLAIVRRATWGGHLQTSLLRSRGFGGVDKEIVWEELPYSLVLFIRLPCVLSNFDLNFRVKSHFIFGWPGLASGLFEEIWKTDL